VGSFIDLSLEYDPEQFPYDAETGTWPNGRPELIHDPNQNGTWSDNATNNWVNQYGSDVTIGGTRIIQGVDPVNHRVYGRTSSLSPFALVRRLAYQWSGVQQPVNQNGSSIFRLGSTVPVKFRLTGSDSTNSTLQARLYLAKISNSVLGTELEAVSTAAATVGNLFRYDPSTGNYVFNWSTKAASVWTYRLRVELGDGMLRTVDIALR
jgi:hypothetical protein